MPTTHAPDKLRGWIKAHGFRHAWVAQQLNYTPQYLSRVLNGKSPVTESFRQRCRDRLSVPLDVWHNAPTT